MHSVAYDNIRTLLESVYYNKPFKLFKPQAQSIKAVSTIDEVILFLKKGTKENFVTK